MVKDAEKNAVEDKQRREQIELRNRLDSQTYEVEKNVKEWGDKVPANLKERIDGAVERARKALRGDDVNEIRAAQEELSKAYSEAGQAFYQQQAAQPQQDAGASGTDNAQPAAEEVVEADYEIVDDKK